MDALSPAAAFARSLKTYDDVILDGEGKEKKQTRRAVVHFDDAKFIAKCKPSSPDYDVELCNYEEITSELFAVGAFGLARQLGIGRQEAQTYMDLVAAVSPGWDTQAL